MSNYGYIGELPLMSDHAYAGLPTYPAPWERTGYSPIPGEIPAYLPQDNSYDYLDNDTRPRQGPVRGAAVVDPKLWDKYAKEAFLIAASQDRLNSIPRNPADFLPSYARSAVPMSDAYDVPSYARSSEPMSDSYDLPSYARSISNNLVDAVIRGDYGNGSSRIEKLKAEGLSDYDIKRLQDLINARLYATNGVRKYKSVNRVPRRTANPALYNGMRYDQRWPNGR